MSIEIKFVLFTFFISFFQLVLLYAFGNIKYKSDPKNNFLVSTVIVFVVLYSVYLYLGNISIKTLLGSILFLSSSVIILFTFWTILIWGFTISLLESLTKLKVSNKEKWIKKYTGKSNLNVFTKDRMRLLFIIDAIKITKKNEIVITKKGIILSFVNKFIKKLIL